MLYGIYYITSVLIDDALLPAYKGSTFRGAFGGALKSVVCAVKSKECGSCMLSSRCVYARVFEPGQWEKVPGRPIVAPHPYGIVPPLDTRSRLSAGERFNFRLLLFDEANDFLPYFVYAFEQMGERGIGKAIEGKRARFRLEEVICDGVRLYDSETRKLGKNGPLREACIPEQPAGSGSGLLVLRLETPLRLKLDNHFRSDLPFHLLVRAMLRRVSGLFACYGNGEPALDYKGLTHRANQVELVSANLRWHDWERYSGRQKETMLFGGLLGSVTYRGEIGEYLPLLELCRTLHIGKQTTFGLGKFDFNYREEP